jgi:hypothetical protein
MLQNAISYVRRCRRLRALACEWQGIDPRCRIVMFTPYNPYGQKYNEIFEDRKYRKAVRLSRG